MTTKEKAIVEVAKSMVIHPSWRVADHISFLTSEGFNCEGMIAHTRYDGAVVQYPLKEFVKNWVKYPERCFEVAASLMP